MLQKNDLLYNDSSFVFNSSFNNNGSFLNFFFRHRNNTTKKEQNTKTCSSINTSTKTNKTKK